MMMSVIYNGMSLDDSDLEEENKQNNNVTGIPTVSQTVDRGQGGLSRLTFRNSRKSSDNSRTSSKDNKYGNNRQSNGEYIQTISLAVDSCINNNIFTPFPQIEPPRPPPPIVGKVTHYSIELYWEEALAKAYDGTTKDAGRIKICLQEEDKHNSWGNIYTGYGKRHTVTGLDHQTEYHYRIRFMNNYGNSEWSAHVNVSTTKEPLTGEHLHRAIMRKDVEEIEKILDTGDVKIDVPDKYGFTGLMQASQKGFIEVVECLLNNGADVHSKNDAGKTALMLASYAGQLKVVKILREAGARYEDFDRGGSTSLHWAVDGGNTYLIEWMIQDGAEVNIPDHNCGWTPLLRCASVSGKRDVAYSLLSKGADINIQDRDGKTALMIAIINGHLELVDLLLKRNADLTVKNEYGKTAYQMAQAMEKRRILRSLDEHVEYKGLKGIKI
ncbi:fibronectin type 3 and ankyrin repeat domains protein 1-like isoform X2 [Mytilus galloprovincialis]|uniref:fibronectin type 3 and ankyrin repeat domains protein 1-like isoform X2 n=1 Tax=Mytilus galloprovincialis TaxID=29158 RepID=UPI003F7B78E1